MVKHYANLLTDLYKANLTIEKIQVISFERVLFFIIVSFCLEFSLRSEKNKVIRFLPKTD